MSYTIVGVIGHIDHGKTSLVAALTGVDTDTHPEEKRRGITIDLGFAAFTDGDHRYALIDAPGHQKYIGNLLAGVSGIDVGLLVVACDQGIQAQTLEHAAILQSLGVSKLIVAISRIDLSDEATRMELSEELDVFLADFGFVDIPKVMVSSVTGEGLDDLRSLLREHSRTADRAAPSQFRMPIDRVFTIPGRGCVVAGTLWSGRVAVGDHVQLSRTGEIIRVRELEVHGDSVSQSQVGLRTAINLASVSASDIVRGDELVAQSTHPTSQRHDRRADDVQRCDGSPLPDHRSIAYGYLRWLGPNFRSETDWSGAKSRRDCRHRISDHRAPTRSSVCFDDRTRWDRLPEAACSVASNLRHGKQRHCCSLAKELSRAGRPSDSPHGSISTANSTSM